MPTPAPQSTDTRVQAGQTWEEVATQPEPLVLRRGDANVSYVLNRVPKRASVELPGYRQAATFELTVDFKELPIDPRTLQIGRAHV